MRMHLPRRQWINHQPVQGALLRHTLLTWFTALAVWALVGSAWDWLWAGQSSWWGRAFAVTLISAAFGLPLILLRLIRLTNRFVGPVHRLKLSLRRLARRDAVQPIRFRQTDFGHELADAFNELLQSWPAELGGPAPGASSAPTRISYGRRKSDSRTHSTPI